jgi:hypothetical protein
VHNIFGHSLIVKSNVIYIINIIDNVILYYIVILSIMHVLSCHVLRIKKCRNFELDTKLASIPSLMEQGMITVFWDVTP